MAGWLTAVATVIAGLLLILWNRLVFRAAITRTAPEELLIRFAPWYEGYVWSVILASPVLGGVGLRLKCIAPQKDRRSTGTARHSLTGQRTVAGGIPVLASTVVRPGCARPSPARRR